MAREMKSYKARGVVLHSVRYGENALIAYLLTDIAGRRSYMIQGVGRAQGKAGKTALYQPMTLLEFEGLESPKMEMHRMKDVRKAFAAGSIATDIRKSTIALFMAETLYRLVRESERNSPLFEFVYDAVETLEAAREGVANFHLWFLVKLSALLGFYPANEYIPGAWFDMAEGCFTPIEPAHRLAFDRENARIFGTLMECGKEGLEELRLSREGRNSFLNAVTAYFNYHLDAVGEIKSIRILREVF